MTSEEDNYYLNGLLDPKRWFRVAGGLIANAKEFETKISAFWGAGHDSMEAAKESKGKDLRSIPSDRVLGTYYMLIAFGVENILKGVIIQRELQQLGNEARTQQRIPKALKSHDLRKLAKRAGISMNTKEEELLLRLTDHAIWRGRYPVPLSVNELSSKPLESGACASQAYYSKGDIEAINLTFRTLGGGDFLFSARECQGVCACRSCSYVAILNSTNRLT